MLRPRIIPTLLIDGERLVKTARFKKPRYVGDPRNAIRIFNEKQVDELILLDIGASKTGAEPNFGLIDEIASECMMPLCYGGGIRNFEDAKRILNSGVEKVSLNTAMFSGTELISSLKSSFGSQAVVVSIDVRKNMLGREKWVQSSRSLKVGPASWTDAVSAAIEAGAGEILITDVNREGSRSGPNLEMVKIISEISPAPIIYNGGIGSHQDMIAVIQRGASAVAVGTFFVFSKRGGGVLISYPLPDELEFIHKQGRSGV